MHPSYIILLTWTENCKNTKTTCCASMAVNSCFYCTWATTSLIWPPGAPKHGAELIFMPSFERSPPISSSKMSNTGKLFYKKLFIRYNLKIRYMKKVKLFYEICTYLFCLISKFEPIKIKITGFITIPVQVLLCMVQK